MNDDTQDNDASKDQPEQIPPPSRWEWVVAVFGFLIVAGLLGYLVYYGATSSDAPPSIEAQVINITPTRGGFLVRIRAFNNSDSPAAVVKIEGELRRNGAVLETSSADLDYLPSRSERMAGLIFRTDPRQAELLVTPRAYTDP